MPDGRIDSISPLRNASRSRFTALKHEIDHAVDTVTASTSDSAAARLIGHAQPLSDPLPPESCSLAGPDLDSAMEKHNHDSERLDQLDVGDFDQLRSLAKGQRRVSLPYVMSCRC